MCAPTRAHGRYVQRLGRITRLSEGKTDGLVIDFTDASNHFGLVTAIDILGADVADLITTIDHNLQHGAADPRFQRKVMYDNVPAEAVEEFRKLSAKQAQELLERYKRRRYK